MKTASSRVLLIAALLCGLGVPFSGCGPSTFSAAGDAGSASDAPTDVATDVVIVVTQPDGASVNEGSAAEAGCQAPTALDCNGTCVDPTQPQHCGSCTNVCDAGAQATCTAGQCGAGCSAPTPTNCGGACTDLQTDPNHCGTCAKLCPGVDGGVGAATCSGGQCGLSCAADGGTPLLCGSYCVDPTAPTSCGSCAMNCAGPTTSGTGKATCTTDGGVPIGSAGDGGPCGIACNTGYHFCNAAGGTGDCLSDNGDPKSDPCVVDFNTGVFVAATTGSDTTGTGAMGAPYKTMTKAITAAIAGKKRVYACIGTYAEQLSLTAADDGLVVYGGLDCANGWKYVSSTATPTLVAPGAGTAAPGTALTASGSMLTGIIFQDVSFASPDETALGASSVAVFATNGAKLTLTRASVTAGGAGRGSDGSSTSNWSGSAAPGQVPPNINVGGTGGTNGCSDGASSTGGQGGVCSAVCFTGSPGTSQPPISSPVNNGGNTSAGACGADDVGKVGGNGDAATQAGAGATSSGSILVSGWTLGAAGGPGINGHPGQGGGGGGGALTGGAGAGGGAGGCGGGRGLGASGGGSSIGVLVFQSAVSLVSAKIATGAAGGGGTGGPGQGGQSGGGGGPALNSNSCGGGTGGSGSSGSGGGGGAGGNAVGIAWTGTTGPSIDGTVISQNQPTYAGITLGAAGLAGSGGGGLPNGNPGAAGLASAVQQF